MFQFNLTKVDKIREGKPIRTTNSFKTSTQEYRARFILEKKAPKTIMTKMGRIVCNASII